MPIKNKAIKKSTNPNMQKNRRRAIVKALAREGAISRSKKLSSENQRKNDREVLSKREPQRKKEYDFPGAQRLVSKRKELAQMSGISARKIEIFEINLRQNLNQLNNKLLNNKRYDYSERQQAIKREIYKSVEKIATSTSVKTEIATSREYKTLVDQYANALESRILGQLKLLP